MNIWDAFGHAVTLNFDLLTPKSNQFISVPRCTSDKSLAKIRQQKYWRYRGNIKLPRESRTDARKHIGSAGAYRRRRLKNINVTSIKFSSIVEQFLPTRKMLSLDCNE